MRASIASAFERSWVRSALVVVTGILLAVAVGLLIFQVLPDLFAPERSHDFGIAAEAKARADVRTSALQLLGGLVIAIGAVLTARNVQLTRERNRIERESQITERFTRAIDQLGSRELDIRLGGIYALERIARDSRDDHWTIMEVLTAFVREHAAPAPVDSRAAGRPARPTTDVQAVLTVLGRRDVSADDGRRLDLRDVDMQRAQLGGARFAHAELTRARLAGAQLTGADLSGAALTEADLRGAFLLGTDLTRATLMHARLDGAILTQATCAEAQLFAAGLSNAHLGGASLIGVHLTRADLSGAYLVQADLSRADLSQAHLAGAIMLGADLSDAKLHGVSYSEATRWPDGFDPTARGAGPA